MKKIILFAMFLAWNLSSFAFHWEETREQSMDVNPNDILEVSHRFGQLELIEDQTSNVVSFTYIISMDGSGEKKVKERLQDIDIRIFREGNKVIAETKIGNSDNNGSVKIDIKAIVHIPNTIFSNVSMKYGNFITDKLTKNFNGEIKYGNATINELKGMQNSIVVKYGNLKLGNVPTLQLEVGYSGSTRVEHVEKMSVESDYSTLFINSVKQMNVESKFDNYNIGQVENLNIEMGYTTCNIENLQKSFLTDECKYGKVNIQNVAAKFEQIKIESAYTPINIGVEKDASCQLAVSTSYASIDVDDEFQLDVTLKNKNCVVGTFGKKQSKQSMIKIESSYGNVKISAK